jgi:hypothetical protein
VLAREVVSNFGSGSPARVGRIRMTITLRRIALCILVVKLRKKEFDTLIFGHGFASKTTTVIGHILKNLKVANMVNVVHIPGAGAHRRLLRNVAMVVDHPPYTMFISHHCRPIYWFSPTSISIFPMPGRGGYGFEALRCRNNMSTTTLR